MSTPLIFLHGALGSRAQLAPLAGRIAPAGVVHLTEFAGHGATPFPPPGVLRVETLAAGVLADMNAAGIATAKFFGYSMGGYVALWLARHHPARVARIATLGTKLHWTAGGAAREAAMLDPATIRAKVPAFADRLAGTHTAMGWEALLAATAEMMTWMGENAPLTEEAMRAIPHPVRIIVGDRDSTVSVEECARARGWLADAELEVLPRTPHPFERVPIERLAASVREFLTPD
ncbi:MAG: alpha/beta fold hydrolase [Gemmatimonadota bacterium]